MAHQLLMDMEFFPHPGTRKIAGFEIPSHRVVIWEVRLKFLLCEVLGSLLPYYKHWFKLCSSKVPFYFLAALFRDNPRMGPIHFVREL